MTPQFKDDRLVKAGDSPNLDFLRSVAVMFVVICHALALFQKTIFGPFDTQWLGRFGVLIFFVHTCLVLMFSMERHHNRHPESGIFLPFYIRRCFRIYPLSIVVVLTVTLFRWPVAHLTTGVFSAEHPSVFGLISNLLLIQNITRIQSVIAPLWTLPYEVQMYIVLPVIFILIRRTRSTVWMAFGLWAASILIAKADHYSNWLGTTSFLTYGPCFMAGVVSYVLMERWKRNWPFFYLPLLVGGLTALFVYSPTNRNARICCLLLGMALPKFREMKWGWFKHTCKLVARYSYSFYLTHVIAMWFAFRALAGTALWEQWVVFIITTVIIAVGSYHAVEAPFISLGTRFADTSRKKQSPEPLPGAVQN